MSPVRPCPDCGALLPSDAPRGLCPHCLIRAALARPASEGPAADAELTVSLAPADPSPQRTAGALAALAESLGGIPSVLLHETEGSSGLDPIIQPGSPEMPNLAARSAHLQRFGEIARGGMGAVLKGRDVDLGRDLVVKVLLEKHRDKPEMARRFIEEAQIAGQLQHPGAGVRDPDARAKPPETEPDAWRALWAEVDPLLK
jgi:serine/threonine-protein kinase